MKLIQRIRSWLFSRGPKPPQAQRRAPGSRCVHVRSKIFSPEARRAGDDGTPLMTLAEWAQLLADRRASYPKPKVPGKIH
jgi:hypothetical protein